MVRLWWYVLDTLGSLRFAVLVPARVHAATAVSGACCYHCPGGSLVEAL